MIRSIEVDIDDFDDDVIVEAATRINARVGGLPPDQQARETVADLAQAITRGDPAAALQSLRDLVAFNPALSEAIEIGKNRRRP